jgi:hypothetical protein
MAVGLNLAALNPASAGSRAMGAHGVQPVNVSVGFNSQIPLSAVDEETVAAAQQDARLMLYRLAMGECGLLKQAIAETCRLTHLNVSSNIQNHGQPGQPLLYVNSNATFTITLKKNGEASDLNPGAAQ